MSHSIGQVTVSDPGSRGSELDPPTTTTGRLTESVAIFTQPQVRSHKLLTPPGSRIPIWFQKPIPVTPLVLGFLRVSVALTVCGLTMMPLYVNELEWVSLPCTQRAHTTQRCVPSSRREIPHVAARVIQGVSNKDGVGSP